ncbi:MAG: ATP-binding protein [Alphaproteobacteria bacterium]|nr:ATP-binding protein [Alphaproteobacteria bacterium]
MSFLAPAFRILAGQAMLALLFFAASGEAIAAPKRVLLLYSFGLDAPPWGEYSKQLRSELFKKFPNEVDLFEATLETARFPGDVDDGPFADYLAALFSKRPLDLVITVAVPAALFVQRQRQRLFVNTPHLIARSEQRRYVRSSDSNETAVLTEIDFLAIMQSILHVLPTTEHIAIVLGASPLERYWKEQIQGEVEPLKGRVAFTWFNDLSFEDMLKTISRLPPKSAVFFATLAVDANGVPQMDPKVFSRFRDASNAPIFGYEDSSFGSGLVGGPMLSISEISRNVVDATARIVSGAAPSGLPATVVGLAAPRYDWRELQRWGIQETNLPARSRIDFREPSFWSQHRWTVIGITFAVLVQTLMISALLFERFRRRRAEAASRKRLFELAQMNRSLTVSAMSSSIAHELNQPLGAILNNAGAAEVLLSKSPPDIDQLKEIIADIRKDDERAGEIIGHLRGFLRTDDVPPGEVSISRAIEDVFNIIEPEAGKHGISIEHDQLSQPLFVRADRVHLQQVLLNLALNGLDAMKDISSSRLMVFRTTQIDEASVEIAVLDTGTGIPKDKLKEIFDSFVTTKQHGTGLGLSIARTIVEMYGGRIWAENRDHGGAAFRLVLPLVRFAA